MSDESESIQVYLDALPNFPKNDEYREVLREILRREFEGRLDASVERTWDLPQLLVKPQGTYLELLLESRHQYVSGRFYSCVAMCGIVGERLVKDMFRSSVLVRKTDSPEAPSDEALDQLERVEVYGIVNFLKAAKVLSESAARAAKKLGELRNDYAHARGKNPQKDALAAIQLLHTLVEDTVSILKHYTFEAGRLVPREAIGSAMPADKTE
jgi:hypothetical protein